MLRQFSEFGYEFSCCFSLKLRQIDKDKMLHNRQRWRAEVSLNQFDELLEDLVHWLLWSDQVICCLDVVVGRATSKKRLTVLQSALCGIDLLVGVDR